MTNNDTKDVCAKCGQVHTQCKNHPKRKNTGGEYRPCMTPPMANGCCYRHGGASLKGIESKTFVHGGTSKYLPDRLGQRLHELNQDRKSGELFNLAEQIKVVELRISQLNQKLTTADSLQNWKKAQNAAKEVKAAMDSGDADRIDKAFENLEKCHQDGAREYHSWQELFNAQNHLDKLATNQTRRMLMTGHAIMVDQVVLMLSTIVDSINRKVSNADELRELRNDIYAQGKQLGLINK